MIEKHRYWEMILDCPCMASMPVRVRFDFHNEVDLEHFNMLLEHHGLKEPKEMDVKCVK